MFTVEVKERTPAGVILINRRDYYDAHDALTVAEIERKTALIPTGRTEEFDPHNLAYEIEGAHGDRINITVTDTHTGSYITLRDPMSL